MKSFFNKNTNIKLIIFFVLIFCLLNIGQAKAVNPMAVETSDTEGLWATTKASVNRALEATKTWLKEDLYQKTIKEGAAAAAWSAASQALNTIAYDTATWLGSGNEGQKPVFVTEGWGTYINNIGDNAAGRFIEDLGRNGVVKFNLCEPSFGVKTKIGLGLVDMYDPETPACTFTKMLDNWDEALNDEGFLVNFQDMFNPESSDISIALSLQTRILEDVKREKDAEKTELIGNNGYINLRNISGTIKGIPVVTQVGTKLQTQAFLQADLSSKFTGTFMDAVNIFLNQLAITSFNRLMSNLGGKSISSPYSGNYGDWLTNPEASPNRGGIREVQEQFQKLVKPNFTERSDYDILAELSSCPDISTAGPTNCVIEESFRQAISQRLTVGQALKQGYLNPKGIFGYSGGLEPFYKDQNYPYRSMIILRKFRIIPVGWEVAAQYIGENVSSTCTIGDMVACYNDDSKTEYGGYESGGCDMSSDWCNNFVDPDWVLKAPKNYCAKQGYGNQFVAIRHDGDTYNVSRLDNYCADEQTCIKEADNGACEAYGYCTEERSSWNFSGDSCDPLYNTCQTYTAIDGGKKVSYLENNLEFCDASEAGCLEYCNNYELGTDSWLCNLNSTGDKLFFNGGVDECNDDDEGCHQFVRVKSGLGVNLLKNASFEDASLGVLNDDYWSSNNINVVEDSYIGAKAISINNSTLNHTISIGKVGYKIGGTAYTLSFWAKDCDGDYTLGGTTKEMTNNEYWERYEVNNAYSIGLSGNQISFSITADNNNCLIDGVMLEKIRSINETASEFKDYKEGGVIHEKLLPEYLEDVCVNNNGNIPPINLNINAPGDFSTIRAGYGWMEGDGSFDMVFLDSKYLYFYNTRKYPKWWKKVSFNDDPAWSDASNVNIPDSSNLVAAYAFYNDFLEEGVFEEHVFHVSFIDRNGNYYRYHYKQGVTPVGGEFYSKGNLKINIPGFNEPEAPVNYNNILTAYSHTQSSGDLYTVFTDDSGNYYEYDSGGWNGDSTNFFEKGVLGDKTVDDIWHKPEAPDPLTFKSGGGGLDNNGDHNILYLDRDGNYTWFIRNGVGSPTETDWTFNTGTILQSNNPINSNESIQDECDKYVRKCTYDEVGCEMYTSKLDKISIPAKVIAQNYCPAECVGYDMLIQDKTYFEPLKEKYFIPDTADKCNASNVGCSEFTNLDKIEEGGETKEYYSYLRRCIKPNDDCAEFYTWEGSDETGFQLKVFSLQSNNDGTPYTYADEFNDFLCDADSYNPDINPTCRQFYNKDGDISYAFYQYTVSCSDDCHPFRLNNYDIEDLAEREADCVYMDGDWRNDIDSCIFMAIPDEGTSCSANNNGCKKYTGNEGSNIMIVGDNIYDFESGVQNWSGGLLSSESSVNAGKSFEAQSRTIYTVVGTEVTEGKAYELSFIAKNNTGNETINLAATLGVTNFSGVAQIKGNGEWGYYTLSLSYLDHAPIDSERLSIIADIGQNYFIDNIILTERMANYYLIKNSWNTPWSCDHDINDLVSPREMMGCDVYTDRDRITHYLKDFDQACAESAVGCELMIDTHNLSSVYKEKYWESGDQTASCNTVIDNNCVHVAADSYDYVVYDKDKECSEGNKGCEMFGYPYRYGGDVMYTSVYLLNNPDKYSSILCGSDDDGCAGWNVDDGYVYFKDPVDNTCEWRNITEGLTTNYKWVKSKVKRCDMDSDGEIESQEIDVNKTNICFSSSDCGEVDYSQSAVCNNDFECIEGTIYDHCIEGSCGCKNNEECGSNQSCVQNKCMHNCIIDENDYDCPIESDMNQASKTFGLGGNGNNIDQPETDTRGSLDEHWIGLCPKTQSSCSEYIDPVSKPSVNLINNSDFSYEVNNFYKNWENHSQRVILEPYTLYVLRVEGNNTVDIEWNKEAWIIIDSNRLQKESVGYTGTNEPDWTVDSNKSVVFYTGRSNYWTADKEYDYFVYIKVHSYNIDSNIELKKAIINYQLEDDIGESDCNGVYRSGEGCIVFNKRSILGASGYEPLVYNMNLTGEGETPSTTGTPNANTSPLKVEPDRLCNQWLACKTLIKDEEGNDVCYDIGLCDSFNEFNKCDSWVVPVKNNQTYEGQNGLDEKIKNLSGYSKVAYQNINNSSDYYKVPNNLYNLVNMDQVTDNVKFPNGGFEFFGDNGYPVSWVYEGGSGVLSTKQTEQTWEFDSESTTTPYTFTTEDSTYRSWDNNVFTTIYTPSMAQNEGICYQMNSDGQNCDLYNPEGVSFLRLAAQFNATTENIDTNPGQKFLLSYYVNTKNLVSGKALITVINSDIDIDDDNYNIDDNIIESSSISLGSDWVKKIIFFTPPSTSSGLIKIRLSATDEAQGRIYFDDVQIKSSLEINDDWTVPSICRLYPESTSMSCEYYEDLTKKIGWQGYCLEYDRPPGDSNTCLLWYPVDNIRGQGLDENAGYNGKFPVYYCGQVDMDFALAEPRAQALIYYKKSSTLGWLSGAIIGAIVVVIGVVIAVLSFGIGGPIWFTTMAALLMVGGGAVVGAGTVLVIENNNLKVGSIAYLNTTYDGKDNNGEWKNTTCYGSGCENEDAANTCPLGYFWSYREVIHKHAWKTNYYLYKYCNPLSSDYLTTTKENAGGNPDLDVNWYEYNGDLQMVGAGDPDGAYHGFKVVDEKGERGKFAGLIEPVRVYNFKTRILKTFSEADEQNDIMKCDLVYQTVTNTGGNKAWYSRVMSDTKYKIDIESAQLDNNNTAFFYSTLLGEEKSDEVEDNIDIKYSSPYFPYGAISSSVYPKYNPYEWDSLPNTQENDPINVGTGRLGGISFAGTGKNISRLGICSDGKNNCLVYSLAGSLFIDELQFNVGNVGNLVPRAVFVMPETYSCSEDEYCIPINNIAKETVKDNLKRIFAKNFGAWKWEDVEKKCSSGIFDYYPCTTGYDCNSDQCVTYCEGIDSSGSTIYGPPCDEVNNYKVTTEEDASGNILTEKTMYPDCETSKEGYCDFDMDIYKCVNGYENGEDCTDDNDCRSGIATFLDSICAGQCSNRPATTCVDDDDCTDVHEVCDNFSGTCIMLCENDTVCSNVLLGSTCENQRCTEGYCVSNGDSVIACSSNSDCLASNFVDASKTMDVYPPNSYGAVTKKDTDSRCSEKTCVDGYNDDVVIASTTPASNLSDDIRSANQLRKDVCEFPNFDMVCGNGGLPNLYKGSDFDLINRGGVGDARCYKANEVNAIGNLCEVTPTSKPSAHYYPTTKSNYYWSPPNTICPVAGRPVDQSESKDYCAIPPRIDHINTDKDVILNNGFINLTFNSEIDGEQLPIVMYYIDWGDGDHTLVSGVELMGRPYNSEPDDNNPHSLYHVYDYWDLLAKDGTGTVACGGSSCNVMPQIKIKDNWGWCNNGVTNDPCPSGGYQSGNVITVEK